MNTKILKENLGALLQDLIQFIFASLESLNLYNNVTLSGNIFSRILRASLERKFSGINCAPLTTALGLASAPCECFLIIICQDLVLFFFLDEILLEFTPIVVSRLLLKQISKALTLFHYRIFFLELRLLLFILGCTGI